MQSRGKVRLPSRQQLRHHIPMHVGQAEIAALEAVGELGVVEAEQVQDRGVQVVDSVGQVRSSFCTLRIVNVLAMRNADDFDHQY